MFFWRFLEVQIKDRYLIDLFLMHVKIPKTGVDDLIGGVVQRYKRLYKIKREKYRCFLCRNLFAVF